MFRMLKVFLGFRFGVLRVGGLGFRRVQLKKLGLLGLFGGGWLGGLESSRVQCFTFRACCKGSLFARSWEVHTQ